MNSSQILQALQQSKIQNECFIIAEKVLNNQRINFEECEKLYTADLGFLGMLANYVREKKHGHHTFFNRNFHIEPTNICVFTCSFCSYSRLPKEVHLSPEERWELNEEQIMQKLKSYDGIPITEVHIVGGVHPKRNIHYYGGIIKKIKGLRPDIHIKGFTAVELEYMFRKAKLSYDEGLSILKEYGLDSLPGGGAEIFHPEIREQICADKATAEQWLAIHEAAHKLGMHTNATMLYGHIEKYYHRVHHMNLLRELQDKTAMFNTFIPLKFRNKENDMAHVPETTTIEDLKNYAVSRIFLDNIPHIKSYWPMIGKSTTQLSLSYGVDDIDGTIDDSTKIYSMAGAEDQRPVMTTDELIAFIKQSGRHPIERDTLYNVVKDYSEELAAPAI
jgi:aminodeoxyfutalosine synthase